MENVKVTVYLSTFNQEKYIREALDSILMQKTNFNYELLVADDCSTDNTQNIVLEYKEKYPDIIKTYFTPVNVGGCQKLVNCIDNGYFTGEYIAFLEGDDYWLNENRLQILVDFLDKNPKYSRVSHKRLVIDENGNEKGFDISDNVLNKEFYIEDFLDGKAYSDFGSVFRNYFKECTSKYNELLLASRNVCDFQDMFITQDFGPVFVLDECFGVYRSVTSAGASNYNSITTQSFRSKENIRLAKAVESFYNGKYDMSYMIKTAQKRLILSAVQAKDNKAFKEAANAADYCFESVGEVLYLSLRGKRNDEVDFIKSQFSKNEFSEIKKYLFKYAGHRVIWKISGKRQNESARGTVIKDK